MGDSWPVLRDGPDDGEIVLHCGHLDATGPWQARHQAGDCRLGWFYLDCDSILQKSYFLAWCDKCSEAFPRLHYGRWVGGRPIEAIKERAK